MEPEPRISRKIAIQVRPTVNPRPIPIPSKADSTGPFFAAYASARPRIIQFTTISGIKIPSDSYRLGIYACRSSCTIVTREATITIYAGIRTRSGIIFRNAEINKLEKTRTAVVDSPMPTPLMAVVVTARVGHIPSIRTKVGFSLIIPLYKRSTHLFMTSYLLLCQAVLYIVNCPVYCTSYCI